MNDGGALNSAKGIVILMFVAIVRVVLVFHLLLLKFFRIWLQAKLSRADVTFAELIGMWLRKVDVREIVLSRITAVQAGLDLTVLDLESHYHAGGNVAKVVRALILAKRENIDLSWKDATTIDLAGRDVLAEVQAAIETRVEPDVKGEDGQELHFGDVGEAVTDLNPRGQAKFKNMVVDVATEGLFISKKTEVEIVESNANEIIVRAVRI